MSLALGAIVGSVLAGAWSGRWAPAQVDREGTALGAGGHSDERQQRHRGPRLRVGGPRQGHRGLEAAVGGGGCARTRRGAAAGRASPTGAVMGAFRGARGGGAVTVAVTEPTGRRPDGAYGDL